MSDFQGNLSVRRGTIPVNGRPDPAQDAQDVRASLGGDGEAYARLVGRHQGQITRRMWRFTRDRRMLEELVQDVFVEAYVNLRTFRGAAPFSHWLNRIATRVGYRFWKSRKSARREVHPEELEKFAAAAEGEPPESAEAAQRLHELLAAMPPRDRLVLTLMYVEELPVAEVARQTGWSRVMVKVQAFRARKKLKKLLEKAGFGGQGE